MMRSGLMFCLSIWLGCGSISALAEENSASLPKPRSLFDGKTLAGWEIIDFGAQGEVKVKDGAIVLEAGEPITGIRWKGEKLPTVDYEISMLARRVEGSDFFATLTFPVQKNCCSLVLGGWGGGLIGLSSIDGSDASENETTDYFEFEDGRWYKIRVRVTQTHIQAWIDDKQIVNVDYTNKGIGVRIEMELSKPLGLASFQTIGAIKDLKMQSLKPLEQGSTQK